MVTRKTPAQRRAEEDVAVADRLKNAMQELLGAEAACRAQGLDVQVEHHRWGGRSGVTVRRSFKTGKSDLVATTTWEGTTVQPKRFP